MRKGINELKMCEGTYTSVQKTRKGRKKEHRREGEAEKNGSRLDSCPLARPTATAQKADSICSASLQM